MIANDEVASMGMKNRRASQATSKVKCVVEETFSSRLCYVFEEGESTLEKLWKKRKDIYYEFSNIISEFFFHRK